jgi:hypothetical protein
METTRIFFSSVQIDLFARSHITVRFLSFAEGELSRSVPRAQLDFLWFRYGGRKRRRAAAVREDSCQAVRRSEVFLAKRGTGGQGSFSFTANDSRLIHHLDLSQIEKKVSATWRCFIAEKMKGNEP